MAKKKEQAAQTNEATAATPAIKRTRAKSEYVIERAIADLDNGGLVPWEAINVEGRKFSKQVLALKYLTDPSSQIAPGDYRIVVVKWQRTVKAVQQTVISFE